MLSCDRLTLTFFLCSAASVSRSAVPTILSALICYNSITYCIFVLLNMIVLLNVINRTKIGKNTLGLILLALYSLRWRSKWICFVCVFDIILSAHFGCIGNHFGRGGKWLRGKVFLKQQQATAIFRSRKSLCRVFKLKFTHLKPTNIAAMFASHGQMFYEQKQQQLESVIA